VNVEGGIWKAEGGIRVRRFLMFKQFQWIIAMSVIVSTASIAQSARAQDTLSDILLPGENWQLAAEGFKFTDGPAVDASGVLYFADVRAQ
jgi:hypothetical protein